MSEQRLIDANAFKRYLDDGDECINCPKKGMFCGHHCELDNVESNQFARIIDEQPTVDAVPVRCKDCKYHDVFKNGVNGWCNKHECPTDVTYFCADGERRTDGNET